MRGSVLMCVMTMVISGCAIDTFDNEGMASRGGSGVEDDLEEERALEEEGVLTVYYDEAYIPATSICASEYLAETHDSRIYHYLDEIRNVDDSNTLSLVCSVPTYYTDNDYDHYWDTDSIIEIGIYGDCNLEDGSIVVGLYTRGPSEETWANHGDSYIYFDESDDTDYTYFNPTISASDESITLRVILPREDSTYGESRLVGFFIYYMEVI